MTVYTINEPYKSQPSVPSSVYLEGILEGCRENGISEKTVREAAEHTRKEVQQTKKGKTRWRNKQESRSSRQKCLKGSYIWHNLRTPNPAFPSKVFKSGQKSNLGV